MTILVEGYSTWGSNPPTTHTIAFRPKGLAKLVHLFSGSSAKGVKILEILYGIKIEKKTNKSLLEKLYGDEIKKKTSEELNQRHIASSPDGISIAWDRDYIYGTSILIERRLGLR